MIAGLALTRSAAPNWKELYGLLDGWQPQGLPLQKRGCRYKNVTAVTKTWLPLQKRDGRYRNVTAVTETWLLPCGGTPCGCQNLEIMPVGLKHCPQGKINCQITEISIELDQDIKLFFNYLLQYVDIYKYIIIIQDGFKLINPPPSPMNSA